MTDLSKTEMRFMFAMLMTGIAVTFAAAVCGVVALAWVVAEGVKAVLA